MHERFVACYSTKTLPDIFRLEASLSVTKKFLALWAGHVVMALLRNIGIQVAISFETDSTILFSILYVGCVKGKCRVFILRFVLMYC